MPRDFASPSRERAGPTESPGRRGAVRRRVLAAAGAAILAGCVRSGNEPGEWYSNWDLAGGCQAPQQRPRWVNALGEPAGICPGEDAGSARTAEHPEGWTWVFYGAPWCSTSQRQAARMREFVARVGAQVEVYTVLTAAGEPFTVPTSADARAWSGTTGLPPRRVLFDPSEADNRTIPQHLLIGPDGRTWWRFAGGMPVEMMVEVLDDFRANRRRPRVRCID